jgi:recombination protein RecR
LAASAGPEIERLIALLAKLPGLGPRSARRAALQLLKRREQLLIPLAAAMAETAEKVVSCSVCGTPDTRDPCSICSDPHRDNGLICVVEEAGSLWAMERSGAFRGKYHVLGGLLSALDGIGPEALRVAELVGRARAGNATGGTNGEGGAVREVVLALPATVDGQTTAHYLAERLSGSGVEVTSLARGVPVGGDLDWLDDGTIVQALRARRPA